MEGYSLLQGQRVRLAPCDPEKDAETESRWTHDPEYLRSVGAQAAVPRSPSTRTVGYRLPKSPRFRKSGYARLYWSGTSHIKKGYEEEEMNKVRRWDFTYMGILRTEWEQQFDESQA